MWRAAQVLGLILLGAGWWSEPVSAEDSPPPLEPVLERALPSGWDAIAPATRSAAPNQQEYDVTIDYRPPWRKGLWLRVRADILDQAGAAELGYQVRLILNWQIPLL